MEDRFLPSPATAVFGGGEANWTKDENMMFLSALAVYDKDTPDRWIKVAALIPRKSSQDVENKYREFLEDVTEIEAGQVSIPGYGCDFEGCRKRPSGDLERKKGVPWTEEEHRLVQFVA